MRGRIPERLPRPTSPSHASGAAHNEMLLGPADKAEQPVSEEGMVLV